MIRVTERIVSSRITALRSKFVILFLPSERAVENGPAGNEQRAGRTCPLRLEDADKSPALSTQVSNLRYMLRHDLGGGIAPAALTGGVDGGDAEPCARAGLQSRRRES